MIHHDFKDNQMKYIKKPCQLSYLFKLNEMGRSMVEMLGVLAVIGVLSIAGIVGFRYAMTKYAANETISEINYRATDLSFQMQQGATEVVMNMDETTRMGYPISARVSPSDSDYFEIFVKNVPSDVCRELLRMPWRAPYSIFVGTEEFEASEEICNQAETVELAYEFYRDLSNKEDIPEDKQHQITRCRNDNECKCGECIDSLCKSICPAQAQCAQDYDDMRWYVCCPSDLVVDGKCCNRVTSDGKCCNRAGNCCPADKPLIDKNGVCYSCDEAKNINVINNPSHCYVCPKRYLAGGWGANWCSLCGVEGTAMADYPLIWDSSQTCYSCSHATAVYQAGILSPYKCENVCDNRIFIGQCHLGCTPEKPLLDKNFKCQDCSYTGLAYVGIQNKSCIEVCPNRIQNGQYCSLPKCPENKPLHGIDGDCYTCNESKNVNVGNEIENCAVCPNRYIAGGAGVNWCSLCGVEGTAMADYPLIWDSSQTCYSCSHATAVYQGNIADKYQCENACSNRINDGKKHACYPECTTENPLLDPTTGKCYDCTYEGAVKVGIRGKSCTDICPTRKQVGAFCIIPDCDENKPLRDSKGVCHACDELQGINVYGVEENCKICPDRYLISGGNYGEYSLCSLCGVSGTDVANKPLSHESNGICYSCDYEEGLLQSGIKSQYQCEAVCSGRFMVSNKCAPYCSGEKPLLSSNLTCQDCNYNGNDIPIKYLSDECETLCPNRITIGDNCAWNDECTMGYFRGIDNICYPCNISTHIPIDEDDNECDKCLNRKLSDTFCVLAS